MILKSFAKINLTLKINSKNKDKLHEIQSFFCLINLADKIKIKKIKTKKDKIIFSGSFAKLVSKSNNSILNLLKILREKKIISNFYSVSIKKTKVIEDEYLDTIENNKSKPRVPFGSLVELGILKPGTTLFDPKKKINAKIMADGSIKYKESEGSIHKVAATIMGAESFNGWTYWHCNINGSTVVIDSLRQKFISETKA